MNKILSKIYYDIQNPAGFTGIDPVWKEAIKIDPKIKRSDVKKFLLKQYTYTIHKPIVRKFQRRRITSYGKNTHWQIDLCDMQKLAPFNQGFKYLLTCYDVFSKMGWARPIRNKKPETVQKAFQSIVKEVGTFPWNVYSDSGKEFVGNPFKDYLKKNYVIHYISKSPDIKAAGVERLNRTLKTRLWRYFTAKKTYKYVDVLQKLMKAINSSYHSVIKMRPIDVTMENENMVRERLKERKKKTKPVYQPGDKVRIAQEKHVFKKGYLPNFTKEIFQVVRVLKKHPVLYKIQDLNGEEIEGSWYQHELVPAAVQ